MDIRLQFSIRNHPKIKKLRLRFGGDGFMGFVFLLIHAAEMKSDVGRVGVDIDDVALAADWRGDPREFVTALIELRLLEQVDGEFRIHDYAEHQRWAAGAKQRSENARRAALAKHTKDREVAAGRMQNACKSQKTASAPSPSPSPFPSPNPNPPPEPPPFPENGGEELTRDIQRPLKVAGRQQPTISIPLKDGSEHLVFHDDINEWAKSYPALGEEGVMQCLKDIHGWWISNPGRQETQQGVQHFITQRLNTEQEAAQRKRH